MAAQSKPIRSDDPQALEKLTARLSQLEAASPRNNSAISETKKRIRQQQREYFVSVRHPRPQEVRHPHRENPTPIPHRWCMAAARIAHGRHAVGSFRNCVQPSHGLAFNGQYMRVVNDTVADGIGHGRIIKQLMPAGDVELRTEDSGCHLTPGFN